MAGTPVLSADAARDALIQVVENVFRTMLGIEIGVAAVRWDPPGFDHGNDRFYRCMAGCLMAATR